VIFVVPLLIESGTWRERVTRVLAIDCPEEVQVARVMARNNLPEAQVRAIMAAQVTRAQRWRRPTMSSSTTTDSTLVAPNRTPARLLSDEAARLPSPNERL
jgi:dephospho-CoA kinase